MTSIENENHCCDDMRFFLKEKKVAIKYDLRVRGYYVNLWSSGGLQVITFCPWCGMRLPENLDAQYWDELEKLGFCDINDVLEKRVPEKYLSDLWWRERGL